MTLQVEWGYCENFRSDKAYEHFIIDVFGIIMSTRRGIILSFWNQICCPTKAKQKSSGFGLPKSWVELHAGSSALLGAYSDNS